MDFHTEYTQLPSLNRIYRELILTRRKGLKKGETLPALSASLKDIRVDPEKVRAYRTVCGLPEGSDLPLLYPHVLVANLQMSLVSHAAFPLKGFGMVHSRQHALRRRQIDAREMLSALCRIGESRPVKAGLEFDIVTVVSSGHEPVYEGISTYLARGKFGEPVELSGYAIIPTLTNENAGLAKEWRLPSNIGRQYAKVSGDYNPIHISSILAKLFGYRKAIVHGMWSAARALAELPPLPDDQGLRADLAFKGPIFVGSRVAMKVEASESAYGFEAYCGSNPRPCVVGKVQAVPQAALLAQMTENVCAPN